jgi:parallel beta-helix repeat protein
MRRSRLVFGVCAVLFVGGASGASAATEMRVDCGAGADLQAAIDAAPRGAILDVSGTCPGLFTIHRKITLNGTSNAVLDGQGLGRTVTISKGNVKLNHLTVTGGDDEEDCEGGGIRNAGTLTLVGVTVANNRGCDNAGIFTTGTLIVRRSVITHNEGVDYDAGITSDGGSVTLEKSTISNNQGTGIFVYDSGTLTMSDSTVSGNGATGTGGIDVWTGTATILRSTVANNLASGTTTGGVSNSGIMTITESTITGNDGDGDPGGVGNSGSLTITATIIAGNTYGGGGHTDCQGTITSNGYNLIGTLQPVDADQPACDFTPRSTDKVGTTTPLDPHLLALGNYGGPTQTEKPAADSPALDAIPLGALTADGTMQLCPASGSVDQRGTRRPKGSACDIGSVER